MKIVIYISDTKITGIKYLIWQWNFETITVCLCIQFLTSSAKCP